MMNSTFAAAAANACDELSYAVVPPSNPIHPPPSVFLPIMDQLESSSFLQMGHQLGSSGNMEANYPALHGLTPNSNATTQYYTTIASQTTPHDHEFLQFCPSSSHHLATGNNNPYGHFAGSSSLFQPYYLPAQEYYFPALLGSAGENMASFGAASLGRLDFGGYRTYYFPARGGYQPPRCQVEGCTADLAKARRYHRRHKVCEAHSKAPVVFSAGCVPQRFCQQCSRFHELDEFDDTKKSCRTRLADHNRRRRKPKPSDADAPIKRIRAQTKKAATNKHKAGSSSKSIGTGHALGTQDRLGSAYYLSKEGDQITMAREAVDPKGKAPMQQEARNHCIPDQNQQCFPLPASSSGSTCFPQSQPAVSGDNTSNNITQAQEPCLALHQHQQHGNILQLGQAIFDLDFDH
ncbi:hypothetical protein ACP70R_009583 [Stipagrostis hirtigluma subsp. patula]